MNKVEKIIERYKIYLGVRDRTGGFSNLFFLLFVGSSGAASCFAAGAPPEG